MPHISNPTAQHQAWGQKAGPGRLIGRTKGGMKTKLTAVTDAMGRPISFFMTAGQVSDIMFGRLKLFRKRLLLGHRVNLSSHENSPLYRGKSKSRQI